MRLIEALLVFVLASWAVQLLLLIAILVAFIRWPREVLALLLFWAVLSAMSTHPVIVTVALAVLACCLRIRLSCRESPPRTNRSLPMLTQCPAAEDDEGG